MAKVKIVDHRYAGSPKGTGVDKIGIGQHPKSGEVEKVRKRTFNYSTHIFFSSLIGMLLGLLIIIIVMQLNVSATEPSVLLFSLSNDTLATEVFYVGEQEVIIRVFFYENYSIYSLWSEKCSMLIDTLNLYNWDSAVGGGYYDFSLEINPSAKPDTYKFEVYLKYPDIGGVNKTKSYEFSIKYMKAFEVIKIIHPSEDNLILRLTVRNYIDNLSLMIQWDADGDIAVVPENITNNNLSVGDYNYQVVLNRISNEFGIARYLSYDILANFNGRVIEINSGNIEFSNIVHNDGSINGQKRILLGVFLVIGLVITNIIYIYMRRLHHES